MSGGDNSWGTLVWIVYSAWLMFVFSAGYACAYLLMKLVGK